MNYLRLAITALLLTITVAAVASAPAINAHQIALQKKAFIQALVTQHHFNRRQLTALLNSLRPDQRILNSMVKPMESKPWDYYRNFFLTPQRITLGAKYMRNHHRELMAMQKKYGIPASVITAIIGVETQYGMHLGKFSVLRALYTLGFYHPPREKFFRKELGQYLLLTRENHLNPRSLKGSYAGALGIPQFMPSSYRYYGVSSTPNKRVDLFTNNDAIVSVANYFYKMGWQANQPIVTQLPSRYEAEKSEIKMLSLPRKNYMEYWAVYSNFNVIMSYNHNIVYVMAVYELSKAIEERYDNAKNARETGRRMASSSRKLHRRQSTV